MSDIPYHSAIPRYHQIAKTLRQQAAAGALGRGGGIATEARLCEEFGVSRTTIRHALALLKKDGVLHSRQGVGTRLSGLAPPRTLSHAAGDPLHAGLGSVPRVVAIERAAPPPAVAHFFGIAGGTRCVRLVRVHDLDGAPVSAVVTWLPAVYGRGVTRAALARQSLHEVLRQRFGLGLKRSVHTVGIARADAAIAAWLKIALADPVLHIQASAYAKGDAPVRWTDNYFNEERYRYTAQMDWNGRTK